MSSWSTGFTTKVEIAQPQPSSGSIKEIKRSALLSVSIFFNLVPGTV
ncbi:hypothetical protein DERP_003986 [Dermatophagoides pteronyssinus]|uniref:Uncharacterized protein n=1 Tax=Dermatophagoides pteronyssinus TaxID=6956 RepID=A0ABQ8J8F6_DERPT|nr:hypothetical protein DERP_003986 [Dermatophagoides pteronyssinus]